VLDDAGSKGTKPRLILPRPPADCVPIYSRPGSIPARRVALGAHASSVLIFTQKATGETLARWKRAHPGAGDFAASAPPPIE